jgi:hypothetical protein
MKKSLFVILLFVAKISFAQKDTTGLNIPVKDGIVIYEAVVNAPGKSNSLLNATARAWLVRNLRRSERMFQTREMILSENYYEGPIIAKGAVGVLFKGMLGIEVLFEDQINVQVDCKDNKYRIKIYDQVLTGPQTEYGRTVTLPEILVGKLTGTNSTIDFNKAQARRMLQSMNSVITNFLYDFNKFMLTNDDF